MENASRKWLTLAGVLALALLILPIASKADGRSAYLPLDQVKSGNYAAAGDQVEVAGKVASDVYAAGGTVLVSGEVGGDIIAVGGKVRITGPVVGNVRVLGGEVELASSVGRNVTVAGGSILLAPGSHVQGHVLVAGGEVEMRGTIEGDVSVAAGQVTMAGNTRGTVELWLDKEGSLRVLDSAVADGPIRYRAAKSAEVAAGAKLQQAPEMLPLKDYSGSRDRGNRWFGEMMWFFGLAVLAMALVYIAPRKAQEIAEEALTKPWQSLGWGALWLILVPITAIILMVTLIGMPLAFVLVAMYFVSLFGAQVAVSVAVGWYLRSKETFKTMQSWKMLPIVLVGLLVYRLATAIPVLGALVSFVAILWGLGAIVRVQRRMLATLA